MALSGACNFSVNQEFYSVNDITWSFQYKLDSLSASSVGFCTFLYDNTSVGLNGGYGLSGLGFGSSSLSANDGVKNSFIVVGIDSTGVFGVSGSNFSTGLSSPIPNSLTIRTGSDYQFLSCIPLSSLNLPVLSSSTYYNTIRFRLTNVGETLVISTKDLITNTYSTNLKIATNLSSSIDDTKLIGFSYATPIISGNNKVPIYFKDIHVHGIGTRSSRLVERPAINREKILKKFLMLSASPISGVDTEINGFVLNKTENGGIFLN